MRAIRMGAGLCLVGLWAGCGDDSGKPGPQDPNDPDPVEALDRMFVEACERQVECGYPLLSQAKTLEACIAEQRAASGEVPASLGGGKVLLSAERIADCTEALAAASCEELANERFELDPSCTTYWQGTVPVGGDCHGGVVNDCVAGSMCDLSAGVCPGTCVATVADCIEGGCPDGEYCSALGECQPKAAIGETCGAVIAGAVHESPCVDTAHCAQEKCVARYEAGESCDAMFEFECETGTTCGCGDAECKTLVCVEVSAVGEPCQTAANCEVGLYCDFSVGNCAARKAAGGDCDDSYGACGPGLVCDGGKCKGPDGVTNEPLPLLEAGADCSGGGLCPLGTLCRCETPDCEQTEKKCLAGAALGASCEAYLEADYSPYVCAEGLCDLFGSLTCVKPAGPGEPCEGEQTFACGSFICIDGRCATLEETRCTVP